MPITNDDPVAQAHRLIADARHAFAADVDALLADFTVDMETLRRAVMEKFDQYLPMRSVADPVLLQLVREALDHFENHESRVDIRDWVKAARNVIGPQDPRRI